MSINIDAMNSLSKLTPPSRNNSRAREDRWLMQMEQAMFAMDLKPQSNDLPPPNENPKKLKSGLTSSEGKVFAAQLATEFTIGKPYDKSESDWARDELDATSNTSQFAALHMAQASKLPLPTTNDITGIDQAQATAHASSHLYASVAMLRAGGLGNSPTLASHTGIQTIEPNKMVADTPPASYAGSEMTPSTGSTGYTSPLSQEILGELSGHRVPSNADGHVTAAVAVIDKPVAHEFVAAWSDFKLAQVTNNFHYSQAATQNLWLSKAINTVTLAANTVTNFSSMAHHPGFEFSAASLPEVSDDAVDEKLRGSVKKVLQAIEDQVYTTRKLHLYRDGDAIQAWLRDLGVNEIQARALWASMASEMSGLGLRLTTLMVNGKKIQDIPETYFSDDMESSLRGGEGEYPMSRTSININGEKNGY